MKHTLFSPIKPYVFWMSLMLMVLLSLTACAGADAPAMETEALAEEEMAFEEEAMEEAMEEEAASFEEAEPAAEEALADEAVSAEEGESDTSDGEISQVSDTPNVFNRLIIKNAEVELMVEDTDTAINRTLGIVTEYSGYVVSNRTWFSNNQKYATLSVGVPADNFEEMLRRLKDLAISVTNENVSGQDVTDEYVDLESRLRNLEATADRIRDFLDEAEDVDESLRVSNQLSQIEGEIEQVKGRMSYLKERAAFSTITLQLTPQPPVPTATPSPTPSPTPIPWSVNQSIDRATGITSSLATTLFQTSVELLVWVVIVILPFALPIVGLLWFASRLLRRISINKV